MSELQDIINIPTEKRKRGRILSETETDSTPPKRSRGRPRKEKPTEPKIPQKRGRKPKPVDPNVVKRPVGRPRKERVEVEKKPIGRPRKHPPKDPNAPKLSRGRPRIHPITIRRWTKRKLDGNWSDPHYRLVYQRKLMRERLRKIRGVKRHINVLDDGRLWTDVKNQILEQNKDKLQDFHE